MQRPINMLETDLMRRLDHASKMKQYNNPEEIGSTESAENASKDNSVYGHQK